jgi:hypothetical protein
MLCVLTFLSVVKWPEFLVTERRYVVFPVRYELNLFFFFIL